MAALNVRSVAGVIAAAIVLPASLLVLGTVVPGIPFLGTAGTWAVPPFAGPVLVATIAGTLLAVVAWRGGARRSGSVLAIAGALAALGTGVVIARHAQIGAANGVSLNLAATIIPRGAGAGAAPDDTTTYTQVHGRDLRVDIYRTRGPQPAPVAIYIHGGGWFAGDRRAQAANLRWLADRGYVGISLDYVLATAERATWNSAASQLACGLSWVAANAAAYGGDPGRLFVLGESAGGALALNTTYAAAAGLATSSCGGTVPAVLAVAAQVPGLDPVTLYQNPDPMVGPFARRMVRRYLGGSPFDHPDRARTVSSATYITPKAPPTLLLLSDNDHLVPIEGALQFVDRATQAGVPLRVVRFPWADHGAGSQYYSVVNQTWLEVMRQHFCRHGGVCR